MKLHPLFMAADHAKKHQAIVRINDDVTTP